MLIKQVPRSDATNVYDLLQDVKQAILEEPRRVDMNFVAYVDDRTRQWTNPRTGRKEVMPAPSCGTVGCFAGWTMLLAGMTPGQAGSKWTGGAKDILGPLNYKFTGSDGALCDVFNWGAGDGILSMKPGTRAYARAVCKRIDRFITANGGKAVLKSRPITRQDQ